MASTIIDPQNDAPPVNPPQAPKPEREHELLRQFEGTWEVKTVFDNEPASEGICRMRMDYGGFWLVQEEEFAAEKGHGLIGYDPGRGKYILTGICSRGPGFCFGQGDGDTSGKVFTFDGVYTNSRTTRTEKVRIVYELGAHDSAMMTFYAPTEDGNDGRAFGKYFYTRQKIA
jgi:hypothetical protein